MISKHLNLLPQVNLLENFLSINLNSKIYSHLELFVLSSKYVYLSLNLTVILKEEKKIKTLLFLESVWENIKM